MLDCCPQWPYKNWQCKVQNDLETNFKVKWYRPQKYATLMEGEIYTEKNVDLETWYKDIEPVEREIGDILSRKFIVTDEICSYIANACSWRHWLCHWSRNKIKWVSQAGSTLSKFLNQKIYEVSILNMMITCLSYKTNSYICISLIEVSA